MTTFIGVDLGPKPSFTTVVIVCAACRRRVAAGVVSYAGKVHEPHCEECCKAWESQLRFCASERYTVTLDYFRAWQAERARAE